MLFLAWMKGKWVSLFVVADEGLNVLIGSEKNVPAAGNPHYTVSQRLAEKRKTGSRSACLFCSLLSLAQNIFAVCRLCNPTNDHCVDAMAGMPENIPTDG